MSQAVIELGCVPEVAGNDEIKSEVHFWAPGLQAGNWRSRDGTPNESKRPAPELKTGGVIGTRKVIYFEAPGLQAGNWRSRDGTPNRSKRPAPELKTGRVIGTRQSCVFWGARTPGGELAELQWHAELV